VTTSKSTVLVLAQINKQMYTFCSPFMLRTNNAPIKFTLVTLNGAVKNVLDLGNGGASGTEYDFSETFCSSTFPEIISDRFSESNAIALELW